MMSDLSKRSPTMREREEKEDGDFRTRVGGDEGTH